jgi:hypothetical protein
MCFMFYLLTTCHSELLMYVPQSSSNIADAYVEPQPLWEYPSKPLTPVFDILHINMTKSVHGVKTVEREGTIELCA